MNSNFIEYDKDGKPISKADQIYEEISYIIEKKMSDNEINEDIDKPKKKKVKKITQSFVRDNLYQVLCKFPFMTSNDAINLENSDLLAIYQNFIKLITMIGDKLDCGFNVDKELFCEYAGFTLGDYNNLMLHGTTQQRSIMERIDGYLYAKKQSASEENELNSKAVTSGLSTRNYGHSAVQATDVGDVIKENPIAITQITDKKLKEINSLFVALPNSKN